MDTATLIVIIAGAVIFILGLCGYRYRMQHPKDSITSRHHKAP